MMGDNRDHSLDSRVSGPVDKKYLLGKVMFVLFSWMDGLSIGAESGKRFGCEDRTLQKMATILVI